MIEDMAKVALTLTIISSLLCLSCGGPKQSSGIYPTAPKELPDSSGISFGSNEMAPDLIDFNIKGIKLGDAESDVLVKLGKPAKRHIETKDYWGDERVLFLDYKGVEFKLDEDLKGKFGVLEIIVSGDSVEISPSIQIGDTKESVIEKLGKPATEYEEEGYPYLGYYTQGNDNAGLAFRDNRLVRLRLWINPC